MWFSLSRWLLGCVHQSSEGFSSSRHRFHLHFGGFFFLFCFFFPCGNTFWRVGRLQVLMGCVWCLHCWPLISAGFGFRKWELVFCVLPAFTEAVSEPQLWGRCSHWRFAFLAGPRNSQGTLFASALGFSPSDSPLHNHGYRIVGLLSKSAAWNLLP